MSIRTGIGIGEAQIFDTSSLVNTYLKSLENAEKRNQKKLEAIADITKDIPETLGTRAVDEKDFKNLYAGIKTLNQEAASRVGTKGYELAIAEVASKVKAYKEAVYRSKKLAEDEKAGGRFLAENVGFVEENDIKKFNERKNTPILNLVGDYDVASSVLIPKTNKRKDVEAILMGREGEQYAKIDLSATENLGGGAKQFYKVLKPEDAKIIIKEKLLDSEYRRLAYYEYKQRNPEATEINDDIVANNEYNILAPRGAIKIKANVVTPSKISTGGEPQQAVYDRKTLLDKVMKAVPGSDKELLEVSSLPYGTDTKFLNVTKGGKLVKQLFKITVPKSGWESATASNPLLAEYGFGTDDASGKQKVFEFDLSSPDARRGLNVFIDQFSGGKNVPYNKVKTNNPSPASKSANKKYTDTQEKAIARGIKDNPGATREQVIQALGL